jgi:uncharacterized coiled-coil DUF342 family protein
MLAISIDNPIIENYFKDTKTIQNVLEYIAINKIDINKKDNLIEKLSLYDNYQKTTINEQKETCNEIKHLKNCFEIVKNKKLESYPIDELWDKIDD